MRTVRRFGPGALALLTFACTAATRDPGRRIRVGADSLWMEAEGAGDAVVFVHSGILHSAGFDDAARLLATDHRVVLFDRRGYGRSDAPTERCDPVEDIVAVMDAAGVAHATVVGASAAGGLVIALALAHPERVERLVLVGGVLPGFGYSDHLRRRDSANSAPLETGDTLAAMRRWVEDRWLTAPENEDARRRLWPVVRRYAGKNLSPYPGLMIPPARPLRPRLGEIRVPVLLLVGEADIPDAHAHAGALAVALPDARRVVVPHAGHLLFFERPAEFAARLESFERETRSRGMP